MGNLDRKDEASVMQVASDPVRTEPQQHNIELQPGKTPRGSGNARSRAFRKPWFGALLLAAGSLPIFLVGLGRPAGPYFDEPYFVPEARAFLENAPNPHPYAPTLAKPPLGKLVMAVGMKVAGDNPFGWRVAGAVCGALTLPAVFLWTYLLLENAGLAYVAAALALLNNFMFVMSRIAMMDAFLMFFLMWSIVTFTAALAADVSPGARRALFGLSGLLAGLAGACKWNAVDTLAVFFLVTALLWTAPRWSSKWSAPLVRYSQNLRAIGVPMAILGLIALPITAYTLCYWPLCRLIQRPFNLQELAAIHVTMWKFNSTAISNRAITSPWYTWPLKVSPQRALSYLIGNPAVTWGGVAAMGYCARRFWKSAGFAEGLLLLLYLSNYLQWAVTPEKGLFYYYYYPCVMVMGVAIAAALRGLPERLFGARLNLLAVVAAMVVFVWCLPRMVHLEAPWDCMFGCWS